jgi:high mobility group AT-hook protein 2
LSCLAQKSRISSLPFFFSWIFFFFFFSLIPTNQHQKHKKFNFSRGNQVPRPEYRCTPLLLFPFLSHDQKHIYCPMARTKEDAKAANNEAAADIALQQAAQDAGVKKPSGRGRGRPKSAIPKPPPQPYVPTGRPRGRPKGTFKKGGEAKAKAAAAKKAIAALAPGEKRGRGRPRKSDVAQVQEDDQAETAESEANAEAEAEDDVASTQPGIGGKSNRRQRKST